VVVVGEEFDPEAAWRSWHEELPQRDRNQPLKLALARRIAARRAALGLTQQELADRMDTTRSQVTAWETGRNGISVEDLPWIAHHLAMTATNLLGGMGETNPLATRIASLPADDQKLILRMVEALEQRK
jgi:transcriptional regulator with XRE-family HTH domain